MPDLQPMENGEDRNDNAVREQCGRDASCIIQQQILSRLVESGSALTVSKISRLIETPKSTVNRHIPLARATNLSKCPINDDQEAQA